MATTPGVSPSAPASGVITRELTLGVLPVVARVGGAVLATSGVSTPPLETVVGVGGSGVLKCPLCLAQGIP